MDPNVFKELFKQFDDDNSKSIDKEEMLVFINILLAKKDEIQAIFGKEVCVHHDPDILQMMKKKKTSKSPQLKSQKSLKSHLALISKKATSQSK